MVAVARRIVELHDHDDAIPQEHCPVVEAVDLRKFRKLVIENTGVSTPNRFVGWPNDELLRSWPIRRNNFKSVRRVLGENVREVVEVKAPNDLPGNPIDSLALKPLCNKIRREDKSAGLALELLKYLVDKASLFPGPVFREDLLEQSVPGIGPTRKGSERVDEVVFIMLIRLIAVSVDTDR
ncbi:MAG: hypothetical protein IIA00_09565 [Proteobacteria bacterium]|nr:hypothetical protein [Pseudomonadota bacterium]